MTEYNFPMKRRLTKAANDIIRADGNSPISEKPGQFLSFIVHFLDHSGT